MDRGDAPGIVALLDLLGDEQLREALEYDLIALGTRLRYLGCDLTWRDLVVIVRRCPASSALVQAMNPEAAVWDLHAHLLASVIDTLNVANWQRTGKKFGKPKPIQRPGASDPDTETLGRDPLPVDEMAEWLGGAFAAAA